VLERGVSLPELSVTVPAGIFILARAYDPLEARGNSPFLPSFPLPLE